VVELTQTPLRRGFCLRREGLLSGSATVRLPSS
jgi:hypothetical protein